MIDDGWYEDPARACAHERTAGATTDLHGRAEPVPTERCLDCPALRLLLGRPALAVVYRREPFVRRKYVFPEPAPKRPGERPKYIPESWWGGPVPKRYG